MPAPLSPETIAAIIISFLEGLTRDAIADKLDKSQGSVSNVLQNLKNSIGEHTFNILKEFGKHLQKNNVNFDDAIIGFHIKSLLKKLGVDVEKIKSFVEGFYSACVQNGVEPTVRRERSRPAPRRWTGLLTYQVSPGEFALPWGWLFLQAAEPRAGRGGSGGPPE